MSEELVTQSIAMPDGELRVLQPKESAETPDDGAIEWAPVGPYWSVIWRSGTALAQQVDGMSLDGLRVVELGCGLALPSIAAARRGATVLAVDYSPEAVATVSINADLNDVRVETALVNWLEPDELLERGPFDLLLAADVLYGRWNVEPLLSLMPRLAPLAWIGDPGRSVAEAFFEQARRRWPVETHTRGVVQLHRLDLRAK